MGRVQGKVAVVTGAGSGMGQAFAHRLADEGATVFAADIKGQEATAATHPNAIIPVACDVTSPSDTAALFDTCAARAGRLDILCNNAGIIKTGARLHEIELVDWDRVMDVNLRGAFLVLRAALPLMMRGGGGAIVNTSSTSAYKAVAGNGAYTPSKAAVALMTQMTALEYARDGIRCNAICPGPIETPIVAAMPAERRQMLANSIPLGRLGKPEDVAGLVLYLVSDEASFVTGSCFVIDGGRLAS